MSIPPAASLRRFSNNRTFIIASVSALLLALAGLGVNTVCHFVRLPFQAVDACEAIPNNTAVFAYARHGFSTPLPIEQGFWDADTDTTADTPSYPTLLERGRQQLRADSANLCALLRGTAAVALPNAPMYAAMRLTQAGEFGFLYVFPNAPASAELVAAVAAAHPEMQEATHSYRGVEIAEFTKKTSVKDNKAASKHNPNAFSIATFEGLLLAANEGLSVEESIDQIIDYRSAIVHAHRWQRLPFNPLHGAANDKSDPNTFVLYVQPEYCSLLASAFAQPSALRAIDALAAGFDFAEAEPHNTRTDANAANTFDIRGSIAPKSPAMRRLLALEATNAGDFEQILPDNAALYIRFGGEGFAGWFSEAANGNSAAKGIANWVGSEMIITLPEPNPNHTASGNKPAALSTASVVPFSESYLLLLAINEGKDPATAFEAWAKANGASPTRTDNEEYLGTTIRSLPTLNLMRPVLGDAFNLWQNGAYFIVIKGYAVFANTRDDLKMVLEKYAINQTLATSLPYTVFHETVAEQTNDNSAKLAKNTEKGTRNKARFANITAYFSPAYALELLRAVALPRTAALSYTALQKYSAVGCTLAHDKNGGNSFCARFFVQAAAGEAKHLVGGAANANAATANNSTPVLNSIWSRDLGAPIAAPPVVIHNPQTGEGEILVYDVQHNLYLLSKNGTVLWKRPLTEPILSTIFPIDLLGSGEKQLVFNTAHALYMLQHDGNNVAGYPRILPAAAATAGMTAADYGEHSYCFYVPCADGRIYGYEKNGKPLGGWSPLLLRTPLSQPIAHFYANGKDYFCGAGRDGKLYFIGRDGLPLFAPVAATSAHLAALGVETNTTTKSVKGFRIVATDTSSGKTTVVGVGGAAFHLALPIGGGNGAVHFTFADIFGDDRQEYIAQRGTEIAVYGYKGTAFVKLLGGEFAHPQSEVFTVHLASNERRNVATFSRIHHEATLLDESGVPYAAFPIPATQPFTVADLFANRSDVVVSVMGNTVSAYLLR